MKLIFLKLCIRHCPKLYIAYSNWLTSKRETKLVSGALWTPIYDEFYNMLRDAALLIDQAAPGSTRRAHLTDSFDDPYDDTYNEYDNMDDLRSFMVENNADSTHLEWIDEFTAYKGQTQGRRPSRNGVRIPPSLWKGLPLDFQRAWPQLSDAQQRQIGSLCGKSMKNSELSVYQANNDQPIYFTQPMFDLNNFIASQASSVDDDSSFALSESDGEISGDIDNKDESRDDEQLTVQKASAMRRAPGNKAHSANGRRRKALPKKSDLAVGSPIRMMAAPPYRIVDTNGKVVMTFNADARHQVNKSSQY